MKKVDKLVLQTFFGPFVLTFFIALFVLVMQFLWKYVDDMAGKGLEWYLILELLFYASASMVNLALPLAVLLSSIMSFGNLSEHFELTALKSSGISLFRTMRLVIISVIFISIGAFYFSNYALPFANLKFGALLWDIREHKPAFSIEEGVFYNGINGYTIKVGKKDSDNRTIHDILIYDHTRGRGNDDVVVARSGEMYTSDDKMFLILNLVDGYQYQEMGMKKKGKSSYEQLRIKFERFEKIIDLSEFTLTRTDESFFKDHCSMQSVRQLDTTIDSIKLQMVDAGATLNRYIHPSYYIKVAGIDTLPLKAHLSSSMGTPTIKQKSDKIYRKAINVARNIQGFINIVMRDNEIEMDNITNHKIEWHRKFTLSIACFVLFFIGAPLGAIIRKGGLGLPLVVAVIFFVVYHVSSILGEKFAREHLLSSFEGMWLSTIILMPLGIFLTYKAINDSTLFNVHWYASIISKIFTFKIK